MDSPDRTAVRRAVGRSIAAVVVATLTLAMASASATQAPHPRAPIPGYLLDRGRYITVRGAGPAGYDIVPIGINNRGEIVGEYDQAGKRVHGMLRDGRGNDHELRRPGRPRDRGARHQRSRPDRRHLQRRHADRERQRRHRAGTCSIAVRFTRIDFPRATATVAHGINNRGQVVGQYLDAQRKSPRVPWEKGRFTTIDGPAARA